MDHKIARKEYYQHFHAHKLRIIDEMKKFFEIINQKANKER
jgi:hypothetical protein